MRCSDFVNFGPWRCFRSGRGHFWCLSPWSFIAVRPRSAQAFHGSLAAASLVRRGQRRRGRRGGLGGRWRAQAHTADLHIFFEAVGLKEVGEFEGADVAALRPDFALEIEDDGAQVWERVAQAQQFIPHSFPVEGQTQALPGQFNRDSDEMRGVFQQGILFEKRTSPVFVVITSRHVYRKPSGRRLSNIQTVGLTAAVDALPRQHSPFPAFSWPSRCSVWQSNCFLIPKPGDGAIA